MYSTRINYIINILHPTHPTYPPYTGLESCASKNYRSDWTPAHTMAVAAVVKPLPFECVQTLMRYIGISVHFKSFKSVSYIQLIGMLDALIFLLTYQQIDSPHLVMSLLLPRCRLNIMLHILNLNLLNLFHIISMV